jgi:hypothetical protein
VNRPVGVARPAGEHLLGVVLVALAAVPWLAVTGTRTGLVQLGTAIACATIVSLVATRLRRVTVSVELLLSGITLAAVLLLVVVADPLGGGEVLRGLRDGVPRILSTGLPLLDVAWAGVPGVVVVWCTAGVVASTVARTRSIARPVLAALSCFLAGYGLTLGGRTGDLATVVTTEALLLALVLGGFTLLRGYRPVPEQDASLVLLRLAGAAGTVVLAVALGAVAVERGPFLADEPVRPRLAPAATELEPEGPLLVTRRLRTEEPDRVVASIEVDREWSGYVPFAVLDHYDGRIWGRRGELLLPTGGVLPPLLPIGGGPSVAVRDLDVAATSGWLPFVGRIETIEGVSVLHDEGETFRLAEPLASPSYRLRASQPTADLGDETLDDEQASARGSGLVLPLDVVQRPTETRTAGERICRLLALTAGGDAAGAGENLALRGAPCGRRGPDRVGFLRSLEEELRVGRAVEVDVDDGASAGGPESLADLLELVGPPSAEGIATGAPEQFAAAFALIADDYGFPARLVTGFRVEEPVAGEPQQLLGGDAWTWAEVAIEGTGWVVVDPSPSAEDATDPQELERPEELAQPDAPPEEAAAQLGVEPETVVVGPPPPPEETAPPPIALFVAIAAAVLVAVPLLIAGARRGVRRRRRRRGDARARVVGAWHELLDVAHEVDVPDVASRTTAELVAVLAERSPDVADDLAALGPVVDRAAFSTRPVDEDEATRAWTVVRGARRSLRRTLRPRTRLAARWRVAPRAVTAGPRPPRRGRRADRAPTGGEGAFGVGLLELGPGSERPGGRRAEGRRRDRGGRGRGRRDRVTDGSRPRG